MADLILAIHFALVIFIVAGLITIYAGLCFHWRWIRNRGFRITHLLAMAFVTLESVVGFVCPLTTWENALRERSGVVGLRRVLHAALGPSPDVFRGAGLDVHRSVPDRAGNDHHRLATRSAHIASAVIYGGTFFRFQPAASSSSCLTSSSVVCEKFSYHSPTATNGRGVMQQTT